MKREASTTVDNLKVEESGWLATPYGPPRALAPPQNGAVGDVLTASDTEFEAALAEYDRKRRQQLAAGLVERDALCCRPTVCTAAGFFKHCVAAPQHSV